MSDSVVETLMLDLLEWLANGDRSYEEVMDAWRTSCPKLPVWEEVTDRGFVEIQSGGSGNMVRITPSGREFLGHHRASGQALSRTESVSV